jgi:Beta-glucosidase-related glycosidases
MELLKNAPYKNPRLTTEERVNDLISRMTLEQKIAQLNCVLSIGGSIDNMEQQLSNGMGGIAVMLGGLTLDDNVKMVKTFQKFLVEKTELGIPAILHSESLSGGVFAGATNFPVSIGLAATWDADKVQEMGNIIRQQMKTLGIRQALSPVMDVARDLRFGRVGETYGENPTLTSQMSVAYVKGLQGESLKDGIAATAKHFLGYAVSEGGLNMASSNIPPRELREVYAKPFEASIREAGLASVMNSYGSLDNEPVISSKAILNDLLRGELGFEGVTVTDYASIDKLVGDYCVAEDLVKAGIMSMEAGMDMELPNPAAYGPGLREAVKSGDLDVSAIDTAVRRVLSLKFQLGLFENPYPDTEGMLQAYGNSQNEKLSYDLACKSAVLVKNQGGILPLKKSKKIAVIGPNADSLRNLFGGYTYPSFAEFMLENIATLAQMSQAEDANVEEILTGMVGVKVKITDGMPSNPGDIPSIHQVLPAMYPRAKTVLQAIREACPESEIVYSKGCGIKGDDRSLFEEAAAYAGQSDVVIMVMGAKNGIGETASVGEGVDSSDIGLPGVQEELVRAIYDTGKPVILVHMSARPLCSEWIAEHIPAVLEVWHPGQCGAAAIADVLFGKTAPGGKLPFTVIRGAGQIPSYADHRKGSGYAGRRNSVITNRNGYVNESNKPLFPFGHGLSYTQFEISDLKLSEKSIPSDGSLEIECCVKNIGDRAGDEVVQLYFSDRCASMVRPVKELAGFKRVTLAPGEKKAVCFKFSASQTAFLDKQMRWIIESGDIDVMVGVSSEDIILTDAFSISDTAILKNSGRAFYAEAAISGI